MEASNLALLVIGLSAASGVLLAAQPELPEIPDIKQETEGVEKSGNGSLEYGSAHEHAQFFVVVNGTELDFTDDRYELNSKYVHLEGNQSTVVHKHAEGVTWEMFLDTINASINRSDGKICFNRFEERYCGEGRMVFENNDTMSSGIDQGDKLVIVIGGDVNSTVEEYLSKQLSRRFKPQASRGYRA